MTTTNTPATLTDLTILYREPGYLRRLAFMLRGLRKPRNSREYKAAKIELERLSAPATALLLPALTVCLLTFMSSDIAPDDRVIDVTFLEDDVATNKEWLKPDTPELAEPPAEDTFTVDIPNLNPSVKTETDTPSPPVSPQRIPVDAEPVWRGRRPVMFTPCIGAQRTTGARAELRKRYDGGAATETAVMRALRWLKKNQQADGSWKNQKIAMTGLAVLTFLAHGEKPGDSPEFGESVQRAIEFLMRSQKGDGRFQGADGNEYAHPIATYALCEAYGMTLNPNIKTAAVRALKPIIQGQHPTGGWTYRMLADVDKESGKYRDDTSYMGWCAQALKAAHMAQLRPNGLERALKLAIKGFKTNAHPNGGFGYTGSGQGGLTGVGTLCLQLLGASDDSAVKKSLALMDTWEPSFGAKNTLGSSPQYYCYYATQAKFHAGGKRWENWNREMQALYTRTQQIEKNAIKDDRGQDADVGWWANGDAHTDRPVMDTCLAALQLMVYYRYLPTTSKAAVQSDAALAATATDTNDIQVITGTL